MSYFFIMEIKKGEERRDGFGDREFVKTKKKLVSRIHCRVIYSH